ncbi:MAG: hypothetical protein Q8O68_00495 [Candidatus Daviesbacteria bacterium]|nr:hypothetical protein [Candidatus Daviesbacteria bacterium]
MEDYEQFYDDVKYTGEVFRLTIPSKLAKSAGIKEGDTLKVLIKKVLGKEKDDGGKNDESR